MKNIVSSQWLVDQLVNPDLIILDASPVSTKSGLITEYPNIQIKGAVKFDIKKDFTDKKSGLPNMLPSASDFEKGCQTLGITNQSLIVVYDNLGIYTSPRVWWMFKTMGFDTIAVLDGGLPAWVASGFPTEKIKSQIPKTIKRTFKTNYRNHLVVDKDFIKKNITTKTHLLIDARSTGRFFGTQPDPREGLPSGSIPNSVNLPYTEVLSGGKIKSKTELKTLFSKFEDIDKPLIFTCGSGITACIVMLAAEQVLDIPKAIYDGSWTEWALTEKS